MISLWGCAPTEEERKEQEEIEKNKPSLSIQPMGPLTEPETGSSLFQANVLMSKTIEENVTVKYSIEPNTATGQDFAVKTGVISIPIGSTSATFNVEIKADELDEQDEEFTIKLSDPSDNAKLGTSTQSVIIQDAVLDVTPNISIEAKSFPEPESINETVTTTVTLSEATSLLVTVDYNFIDGSATGNIDFKAVSGTVEFQPGEISADISFIINADDTDEFDESFDIVLSNPINTTFGINKAKIIIEDNTLNATKVSFLNDKSVRVSETLGEYKIKLKLSNPSAEETAIPFTLSGLATKDSDYLLKTESPILVPAGETEAEIIVEFVDRESVPEGGESLLIQLEVDKDENGNAKFALEEPSSFTFTIAGEVSLNDTGVTSWYDGNNFTSLTPILSQPGQDADFGQDTQDSNNSDGSAAFSFTHLTVDGDITYDINAARCARDNNTGLVFELKEGFQGLPSSGGETLREILQTSIDDKSYLYSTAQQNWQAKNFRYYWYNSDDTTNGGSQGVKNAPFVIPTYPVSALCAFPNDQMSNYSAANTACNSEVYANALNRSNLCGFKDWSLPTIEQLRSIYNYREKSSPEPGKDFFPNTDEDDDFEYMSSSTSVNNNGSAWCQSNNTGQVRLCNKTRAHYIRMVRKEAQ